MNSYAAREAPTRGGGAHSASHSLRLSLQNKAATSSSPYLPRVTAQTWLLAGLEVLLMHVWGCYEPESPFGSAQD